MMSLSVAAPVFAIISAIAAFSSANCLASSSFRAFDSAAMTARAAPAEPSPSSQILLSVAAPVASMAARFSAFSFASFSASAFLRAFLSFSALARATPVASSAVSSCHPPRGLCRLKTFF